MNTGMKTREHNEAVVATAVARLVVAFDGASWSGKKASLLRERLESNGFEKIDATLLKTAIDAEIDTCPYAKGPTINAILDEYKRANRNRQKAANAFTAKARALTEPNPDEVAAHKEKLRELLKTRLPELHEKMTSWGKVPDDPRHAERVMAQVEAERKKQKTA